MAKHDGVPFPLSVENKMGLTIDEVWVGHYTSKDKQAGVGPTCFYWGKPIESADPPVDMGTIYVVTSSQDYWALYFTYEGFLVGDPKIWFEDEVPSSGYVSFQIVVTNPQDATVMGIDASGNSTQIGSTMPIQIVADPTQ